MKYDINAALERLENNLKEVDSARLQVEKTITSSDKLNLIIAKYVKSLNALHEDVDSLIKDLRNYQSLKESEFDSSLKTITSSCDSIISSFNSVVQQSSSDFKVNMNKIFDMLKKENKILSDKVHELKTLKEALVKEIKLITSLTDKVDKLSGDSKTFRNEQNTIQSTIKDLLNNSKSKIDSIDYSLNENNIYIKTEIRRIIENYNQILSTQEEVISLCKSIKSDIANSQELTTSNIKDIKKGINSNRKIVIGCFIILAILQILLTFVK